MSIQIFSVHGYKIAAKYSEAGEDLIFCIHGLGCSHDSFRYLRNQSELDDVSALSVDLLGFGASDRPGQFSYSMEDQAALCAALLEQIKFGRLHVVAHSMGGAIGLLLPPELLSPDASFANVEGNLIAEDCGITSRRAAAVPFETFETEIFPEYKVQFAGYASLDSASPDAFYRSAQSLVRWSDSGELLKKFSDLRCRKKYFFGDENRNHPTVVATKSFPQVEISRSGHFPMLDNPNDFYSALAMFIHKEK